MTQNFDMISLLPDSLLFIIISLIPFKEAVRTSILSKHRFHLGKNTTLFMYELVVAEVDGDHKRTWLNNGNSCQCLTSTLKVVEMNKFTGAVNVILMLHFLICNVTVLKTININVKNEETEVEEKCPKVEELIMTTTRASNDL
ncbi:FBD protein [Medicago truncatula]|uniref:FBD protein n=1 Tax=Medicago truncatula TaxID=3880 RepID=G7IY39_MEDTR|nr:FBD protein [Medicago truncatula]